MMPCRLECRHNQVPCHRHSAAQPPPLGQGDPCRGFWHSNQLPGIKSCPQSFLGAAPIQNLPDMLMAAWSRPHRAPDTRSAAWAHSTSATTQSNASRKATTPSCTVGRPLFSCGAPQRRPFLFSPDQDTLTDRTHRQHEGPCRLRRCSTGGPSQARGQGVARLCARPRSARLPCAGGGRGQHDPDAQRAGARVVQPDAPQLRLCLGHCRSARCASGSPAAG